MQIFKISFNTAVFLDVSRLTHAQTLTRLRPLSAVFVLEIQAVPDFVKFLFNQPRLKLKIALKYVWKG
jgi:hypothetical protein